jgi:hypothetical protein
MTHTHTHTHTRARARARGRTPLDAGSARRRYLNMTAHSIHNRQNIHAFSRDSNPQTWQASGHRPTPQAAATLKPEPTQHNSLDRLQIRKYKSKTLMLMSAVTLKGQRVGGNNIPVVSVSVSAADIT